MIYYHVLDLETTGLSSNQDEIAEIAILTCLNTNIIDIYHQFFRIKSIGEKAAEVNGLSVEMLIGHQPFKSSKNLNHLSKILKYPIFIHNSRFDGGFMIANGIFDEHYPLIDTLKLCRKANLKLENNKLQTWIKYYGISNGRPHSAISDTLGLQRLIILNGWQIYANQI